MRLLMKVNQPLKPGRFTGEFHHNKRKRTLEIRMPSVRKSPFAQKDGRKSAKGWFNVARVLDCQFDKNQRWLRFTRKCPQQRFFGDLPSLSALAQPQRVCG
jgi:hypothetical protein